MEMLRLKEHGRRVVEYAERVNTSTVHIAAGLTSSLVLPSARQLEMAILNDKPLLILDLDETLLHARELPLAHEPHLTLFEYFIYFRPYLREFIEQVRSVYKLAVWTSSGRRYAQDVCANVFTDDDALEFVWCSERCTVEWDFERGTSCGAKRLRKVRGLGYRLERVLIVDDSPEKHTRNFGNLVRVSPFEGDPNDRELILLSRYLVQIADEPNFRSIEKRGWRAQVS